MTKEITVTLSEAEYKALGITTISQEDWIHNVVHERCRVAIDDIVNAEIQRMLAAGETISGSKEDIVMASNMEPAAVIQQRLLEEIAEQVKNSQEG